MNNCTSKHLKKGIKQPSGSTQYDYYRLICIHKKRLDVFFKIFCIYNSNLYGILYTKYQTNSNILDLDHFAWFSHRLVLNNITMYTFIIM